MFSSTPTGPPPKPENPDCCNDPDPRPMYPDLNSDTITGWVCAECREVLA